MAKIVVAITGASGVVYGVQLANWLLRHDHVVYMVVSEPAKLVLKSELDWDLYKHTVSDYMSSGQITCYENQTIGAPIASGSFLYDAMVIVPCTMSTLAGVAHGSSNNLIERAADVCLKEGRRLVVVPRETPLNIIHIKNMLSLAEAGGRVVPAMPAFYSNSETTEHLVDFMVGKILDSLGIDNDAYLRYQMG